jgi:hypothetical protein
MQYKQNSITTLNVEKRHNCPPVSQKEIIERHVGVTTDLTCGYKTHRTGRLLRENGSTNGIKISNGFKFVRICDRIVLKF